VGMTTTTIPPHRRAPRRRRGLASVAETIGVPVEDLRGALHRGDSIAKVANDHGVRTETIVEALVDDFRLRLAAEAAAGRVTWADADSLAAAASPSFVTLVIGIDVRGAA
jgi:DNA-binding phage protein